MFTSSADVFGLRQSVSDLRTYLRKSGRPVRERLADAMRDDVGADVGLIAINEVVDAQGARLSLPKDADVQEVCRLAAALPSDDYPAFTFSTALLLADRLQSGSGEDDLFWNWESFRDEYALADPAIRAALMNGFRFGAVTNRVLISDEPGVEDCLTLSRSHIETALRDNGETELADFLTQEPTADHAGRAWQRVSDAPLSDAALSAFRYLYERPASLSPGSAGDAPLIPWSAA